MFTQLSMQTIFKDLTRGCSRAVTSGTRGPTIDMNEKFIIVDCKRKDQKWTILQHF